MRNALRAGLVRTSVFRAGGFRASVALCSVVAGAIASTSGWVPLASAAPPQTVISSVRIPFATTDGDILAITKVAGAARPELAIGGDFTTVFTADGASHAARNFAILDGQTGDVLYAGNADSYVRALASAAGQVFLGGDFTAIDAVRRRHIAAVGPVGPSAAADFAVSVFNPGSATPVRAVGADGSGVYFGGDEGRLSKAGFGGGTRLWSKAVTGGSIRAIQLSADSKSVFIGGSFEALDGRSQHGLVKLDAASGAPDGRFSAGLRPDTGVAGLRAQDGEAVLSMASGPRGTDLVLGLDGGGADPGRDLSNEVRLVDPATGRQIWSKALIGDCQALAAVGDSYVAGYHRNKDNGAIAYPYYAAQLAASDSTLSDWDSRLTGSQSSDDGGHNGVQAAFADAATSTLFLAGAFTTHAGTVPVQSLIGFRYGPGLAGSPAAAASGPGSAGHPRLATLGRAAMVLTAASLAGLGLMVLRRAARRPPPRHRAG